MGENVTLYSTVPGGPELLEWFGYVPTFHDAEIVSFDLRRRSESILRVHAWRITDEVDERGHFVRDKHVVVSFVMEDVLDLKLDSFSHQNVVSTLKLQRPVDHPEHKPYSFYRPSADDFEIEIDQTYGIGGFIICRRVSITMTPGEPEDAYE